MILVPSPNGGFSPSVSTVMNIEDVRLIGEIPKILQTMLCKNGTEARNGPSMVIPHV
jgi:hypothetical protein